jgi:hypothetical protein
LPLLRATPEEQTRQSWRNQHRKDQRSEQRKSHCPRHRLEQLSLDALQSEDRKVRGNDNGDGVKNGPLHLVRSRADPVNQCARSFCGTVQMAHDIFDHHHRPVDDHTEVQRTEREQIR